jgi:hypothetical protein
MKRTHLFGTMMACTLAAAVSVGAQDRPSTSQSDREGKSVVVTGCLKSAAPTSTTAATPSPTGTSGSTAAAADSFIITDAVVEADKASTTATTGTASPTASPTAPPTTAGTSGVTPSAKTYAVVGQQSELQGLLNSKVEIRGTLDASAHRSATGAPTTTPPSTAPPATTPQTTTGATMSHGDHGKLTVTSVKQIAGSCSGQ